MRSLRAVHPNRCLAGNGYCKCGSHGFASGNRHEAGEEPSDVGVLFDGLAGLVEGGLRYGVVFGVELELDHVAYCGYNVVGEELGCSIWTCYCDDVDGLS